MKPCESSLPTPSDDLDGLLRTFFRNEMPHPWPAPRTPHLRLMPAPRPAPSRRMLMRSRWALAASVALLLLGSWLLPGRLAPNVQTGSEFNGRLPQALDVQRQELKQIQKDQKLKDFREKHNMPADAGDDGQINALDDPDLSFLK